MLAWWLTISPSHERDWVTEVARLPEAEFAGSRVTVRNVRDFEYRSEREFAPRYADRTYDLDRLEGMDLVLSYWDGNRDIAHLILRQSERIDWHRLLTHMEQYWEVLLIHVLNFRFIYPSERDRVPRWLVDELLLRARQQADLPLPQTKVCRGRLFSPDDYRVDVMEWGFAGVVGPAAPTRAKGQG